MKAKVIIILILMMMISGCTTVLEDPILDRVYTYGGTNNMSGWSVGFQWMGDQEQFRDDVLSGGFSREVNAIGGFNLSLPKDEFALNLLGDTVVRIYYDGEPQFWGFIEGVDIDQSSDTVNVVGGDMIKRISGRKVEYQSATHHATKPPRVALGSKTVFEELIHWWTGETSSDSMFRNEHIEYSETNHKYNYDGNNLTDALSDIAYSCHLTVGDKKHIGYAMWVDGYGDIYLQPYGWREYEQEISGFWKLSLDWGTIKNRIHLRGGRPEAWEYTGTASEESYVYDALETPIVSDEFTEWDVTLGGGDWTCDQDGGYLEASRTYKQSGNYAGLLTGVYIDQTPDSFMVERSESTALNWGHVDEYGNVISIMDGVRMYIKGDTSSSSTDGVGFRIRIGSSDSDYHQNPGRTFSAINLELSDWQKLLIDVDDEDIWEETGTVDFEAIDYFGLSLFLGQSGGAWSGSIYIDGFAVFFKKVDVWRRDNTSINIHGLKEAKFQDGRTTEWATGELMTQQILDLLKNPAVTADTNVPYYDPKLHLNDLVNVEVEGVNWPLYVNKLDVAWSGDHVSTTINAGRPVPTEERVEQALHILRDQDQETGGTNYKVADSYDSSSCVKSKERFCEADCQLANCQNEMQLQACYTFAERDPCIATCQRYKERTGWLNRILE